MSKFENHENCDFLVFRYLKSESARVIIFCYINIQMKYIIDLCSFPILTKKSMWKIKFKNRYLAIISLK